MAKSFPKMITFQTVTTAYYPPPPEGYASEAEAALEGGALDCRGAPLHTLQDFLEGSAPYVSVAMDAAAMKGQLPYGTLLCLPAVNLHYGKQVEFRVVDTGGAFAGKGLTRMDVCVRGKRACYDKLVNRDHLVVALALDDACRKCQKLK